jgi:hypothetical protein
MKVQVTNRDDRKAGMAKRLAEDKRRLAEWRKRKGAGERIPEGFWQRALSYQGELALSRISREFSLDYKRLKEQASGLPASDAEEQTGLELSARFVEAPWLGFRVGPDGRGGGQGWAKLVLERPDGNRLSIEGGLPELGYLQGLVAVFCRGRGC